MVRVVSENNQAPVCRESDRKPVFIRADKTWSAEIKVPAGGLYRIETSLLPENASLEGAIHGDFIHHVGVGDLWAIAGQSGAAGYGKGEIPDGPELGVHILRNQEKWDLATHPLRDTRNEGLKQEGGPYHSPFLIFAKKLKESLGYPVGLIQAAVGGSPLSQWNPKENPGAPLYRNMLHCIALAGGKIAGVCWYQGCSEAMTSPAYLSYLERFGQFVENLRQDLNQPGLPFLTAQLNRYYTVPTEEIQVGWSVVREAQRQAAHCMNNVAVIPTIDLPLSDTIHTSPAGNIVLGQRFASAALGVYYKKDILWHFPEICGADARGGKKVVLRFDNVQHRLHSNSLVVEDFTVEDGRGRVEIEKAEFSGKDEVILKLARSLEGNAFVHNAFGVNPKTSLYEVISNKPILAFYRFKISP